MKQKFTENAFLFLSKTTLGSAWRRWFSPRVLAAVFSVLALQARAGAVLTTLHSFGTFENGADLVNPLVQGADGYLWHRNAWRNKRFWDGVQNQHRRDAD